MPEEMLDLRTGDPFTIMKAAAEGIGIILNDPKPNCKKCHGRGYIGRHADTGEPIPCTCVFPDLGVNIGVIPQKPRNRKERRQHGK